MIEVKDRPYYLIQGVVDRDTSNSASEPARTGGVEA